MIGRATADFFRRILTSLLRKLDDAENRSARATPEAWYKKQIRFPPALVAVGSTLLLYGALVWTGETTGMRALFMALFVVIAMSLFAVYLHRDQKAIATSEDACALLAVVFFCTLIWMGGVAVASKEYVWLSPYATPVAIAPILTALLLTPRLALVLSFAIAIIFGLLNDFSLPVTMVGAIGGATAVAAVMGARTAQDVARAGLYVGVMQCFMALFLGVMLDWARPELMNALGSAFLSGVISVMFSLGVLPFLESFFSRISNLRLVELAAANHPLLKRMSMEAPGTYHHSLIVATLAEDAANAIGANGMLCRVGAYFHDIGKMVKPEYFIENQGTFGNPHDQVSPSLSKLVITSHVKEGMALAKANRLDQQIADFIPQHHGTTQIEYFYRKALKLEQEGDIDNEAPRDDVDEDAYRYPGPKPQTKEAGIVMLADSCEATSRTLDEPSHQRFKDTVLKIINKKLFDGQLDETPLTLRDLHVIAERFTTTLTSVHHARIAYPDPLGANKEKKEEPGVQ